MIECVRARTYLPPRPRLSWHLRVSAVQYPPHPPPPSRQLLVLVQALAPPPPLSVASSRQRRSDRHSDRHVLAQMLRVSQGGARASPAASATPVTPTSSYRCPGGRARPALRFCPGHPNLWRYFSTAAVINCDHDNSIANTRTRVQAKEKGSGREPSARAPGRTAVL